MGSSACRQSSVRNKVYGFFVEYSIYSQVLLLRCYICSINSKPKGAIK